MTLLALTAAIAAGAACLGAGLAAASGPVQRPNGRSSHKTPTPVGGGLGVACGVGASLAMIAAAGFEPPAAAGDLHTLARVIGVAGLIAALGALDDLIEIAAGVKFAALSGLSLLMALAAGTVHALPWSDGAALNLAFPWAVLGSMLWVFTVVNAVNFMDGVNGLVGGALAIAALALGLCALAAGLGAVALGAFALAGALAGFLPWNARRKARVFLGDVGALFGGALIAGLGLMYATGAPTGGVYIAPLVVSPLLADVLLTLASRARRGASLMEGHREHAYQRRLRAGRSHGAVARHMWAQMAGAALLALVATRLGGLNAAGAAAALALGVGVASLLVLTAPSLSPAATAPAATSPTSGRPASGPFARPLPATSAPAPARPASVTMAAFGGPSLRSAALHPGLSGERPSFSARGSRRNPQD